MCFHSEEEMNAFAAKMKARMKARMKKVNPTSFVIMRDNAGNFQEAYYCNALEPQSISNVIRNLRAWHPGDQVVDLSKVNEKRKSLGLYSVTELVSTDKVFSGIVEDGGGTFYGNFVVRRDHHRYYLVLPSPTGVAPPAETPEDTDEEFDEAAVA